MKRKPALFRSWGDALLSLGIGAALIVWLVAGLMIVVASLSKGGL